MLLPSHEARRSEDGMPARWLTSFHGATTALLLVVNFMCPDNQYHGVAALNKIPREERTNLPETGDEAATTTISWASFGGRPQPQDRDFATAIAVASHCVDVDERGEFPAHQNLGVFELGPSGGAYQVPPGGLKITAGHVSLEFRRPQVRGGGDRDFRLSTHGDDIGDLPGMVSVSILLEVPLEAISARAAAAAGAVAAMAVASRADPVAPSAAFGEGGLSTPGLANDAGGSFILQEFAAATEWAAGTPSVRVDLTAAYGNHGDWETANFIVPLTHSESIVDAMQTPHGADADGSARARGGSSATVVVLRANFDWVPEAKVWTLLDAPPVVADVRISDAYVDYSNTEPLLHATLCKRATGSGTAALTTTPAAAARRTDALQATLTPFETQQPRARRTSTDIGGFTQAPPESSLNATPQTNPAAARVVVTEMDDPEWTREKGRGVDTVLSLPRLVNWKPGQWKERRLKRQREEEARKRRCARERAYRREKSRGKTGSGGGSGGGGGGGGNVVSRFVTRVMDAIKGRWRNIRKRSNKS